jgi:hypothetical protein
MQLPTQILDGRVAIPVEGYVAFEVQVASESCPDRPVVQAVPDSQSVFILCPNYAQSTLQPQAHHW